MSGSNWDAFGPAADDDPREALPDRGQTTGQPTRVWDSATTPGPPPRR